MPDQPEQDHFSPADFEDITMGVYNLFRISKAATEVGDVESAMLARQMGAFGLSKLWEELQRLDEGDDGEEYYDCSNPEQGALKEDGSHITLLEWFEGDLEHPCWPEGPDGQPVPPEHIWGANNPNDSLDTTVEWVWRPANV